MQIGAVKDKDKKGKDVKGEGKGEPVQAEKARHDAKKLAEKKEQRPSNACSARRTVTSRAIAGTASVT